MKLVNCKLTQNCVLLLIVMLFIIAFVFVRASITHASTRAHTLLIQYDITPEIGLARLAALFIITQKVMNRLG